jgi:[glutamine synthetase] adenylyltransferase / [glutamine synthetase]-adenylyl-L-tyrosine phosphorylase
LSESKTPNPGSVPTAASKAEALGRITFRDREAAEANVARVGQCISPALAAALPGLLEESPDPDAALNLLERFISGASDELIRTIERHKHLAHYAIVVFGHSRFLGETLIQNPDLLPSFLRERNLDRSFSREEFHETWARFRSRSFENDVALLLSRFKRREYVRIMLRDVLKIAPLAETTAEISALSDVLIEEALREVDSTLSGKYGRPQHVDAEGRLVDTPFTVLSLGKLGGNELNYSSDVDLLYLYGSGQEAADAQVSNREYFVRLAQELTDLLSRMTREGSVFRIDMRLRPQGSEGELAIALDQALRYYAHTAHDWEMQALIKIRHSAGDARLAREFIRGVQPLVYRGDSDEENTDPSLRSGFRQRAPASLTPANRLNFSAIETALQARARMGKGKKGTGIIGVRTLNVKIDRGGIRDVEFLVQCLQRVYGGKEPWLRSGGTLFSLQKLHDKGHISGKDFHELTGAYEFLRQVEHRLQLRLGQQTHRLPVASEDVSIVERSLTGHTIVPHEGGLESALRKRMTVVSEIYNRIIHHQQLRRQQELPVAEFELRGKLEEAAGDQSYQNMLERLADDAPALYEIASRPELGVQARRNLLRFLNSAFTSSERYATVTRHPQALARAAELLEISDYLADIMVRHPEEIATLEETAAVAGAVGGGYLFAAPFGWSRTPGDPVFDYVAESDGPYGEKLSMLRRHYRHRIFATGARDLSQLRPVYESLAANTAAAEDVIGAAFVLSGKLEGLAVLALGRLGSCEFDALSDADLIFVRDEALDADTARKAAEQMVQVLSAYTRDGMVFPVDMRLRPRGGEGELVITPKELSAYFANEAQAWEALSYTKLRWVAGSGKVSEKAMNATKELSARFQGETGFGPAVKEMRLRLDQSDREINFKTSRGSIYDIDFIAGYLLIKHGIPEKRGNLRDRLWRLAEKGFLTKGDAAMLDHAGELLRTVDHVVRLVTGRSRKWLPTSEHARGVVEMLVPRILRRNFPKGLEAELDDTRVRVREIFERIE